MSGNEWQTVSHKSKNKNKFKISQNAQKNNRVTPPASTGNKIKIDTSSIVSIIDNLKQLKSLLDNLDFSSSVFRTLNELDFQFETILALGVGSFSDSQEALLQLAIGLHLQDCQQKRLFQLDMTSYGATTKRIVSLSVADPAMSAIDLEICRALGVTLLPNHVGKYSVLSNSETSDCNVADQSIIKPILFQDTSDHEAQEQSVKPTFALRSCRSTLFYMPHCPYRLYCSVLWTNWEFLDNIAILGNRYLNRVHCQ